MISGTAYGVALNDREQLAGLGEALNHAPYGKPPVAPILYVKPRNCFAAAGSAVALPDDIAEVAVGATIAIELPRRLPPGRPGDGCARYAGKSRSSLLRSP